MAQKCPDAATGPIHYRKRVEEKIKTFLKSLPRQINVKESLFITIKYHEDRSFSVKGGVVFLSFYGFGTMSGTITLVFETI